MRSYKLHKLPGCNIPSVVIDRSVVWHYSAESFVLTISVGMVSVLVMRVSN
ncbi:hypothetical protein GFK82_00599 [Candidatus Steffania adelgidicola]|nr:hypothetical protein GFK82_00599 [Candidatus Steffania adelgidicola]